MKRILVLVLLAACSCCYFVDNALADTIMLQPSNQDSTLDQADSMISPGSHSMFYVHGVFLPNMYKRGIVQFDLSTVPTGLIITSATLKLYINDNQEVAGRIIWAYRVTESWTESGVTWNSRDGSNPWSTAGGTYTTTGGASSTAPSGKTWMTWDVTDIVKEWTENGQPNYGFLLKDGTEQFTGASKYAGFLSKEGGRENDEPILEIEYSEPSIPVGGIILDTNPFPWIMLTATVMVFCLFAKTRSKW